MTIKRFIGATSALLGLSAMLAATGETEAATVQACPGAGNGPNPATAVLGGTADCWVGPDWENGITYARGSVDTVSGVRRVGAYQFSTLVTWANNNGYFNPYAVSIGYNSSNSPTCNATDTTANGSFTYNSAAGCAGTTYANVYGRATAIH